MKLLSMLLTMGPCNLERWSLWTAVIFTGYAKERSTFEFLTCYGSNLACKFHARLEKLAMEKCFS